MCAHRRLVMVAAILGVVTGGIPAAATRTTSETVLKWNRVLQSTIAPPGNPLTPRSYAMMHIAMFDAVNAIEREFEPYRVRLRQRGSGSPDAAAAQAAHDVLVALNPIAASTYDAALAEDLGDRPSEFIHSGARLGAVVAKQVLAWREHDGWIVGPPAAYSEPLVPGRWQPTPPANAPAAFAHLQAATPMAVHSSTQFLPPPPPSLTSTRYAADLNEVKQVGRVDSTNRTAEQTAIARLWSGVDTTTGFFAVWNNVTRDVARSRHLSLVEAARLFVLVNVSIHDAIQTTQASKFVYGLWRPVTAIRAADTDLNADTDPDVTWLPLITTPPYPSYAGNLATIGASAARALELATERGDEPVAVTWTQASGGPDVTRHFRGFWDAAEEEAMARIWGGVHYRFDQEAGQHIGRAVAEFVHANVMAPRRRSD